MNMKALILHFQSVEWRLGGEKTELKTRREIMLLVLVLLLMVSSVTISESASRTSTKGVVVPRSTSADYLPYDPFNITSNEDFINQGWPGSGTANDPFRISGLSIGTDSLCVGIFNTTSHFVIEDCNFTMNPSTPYQEHSHFGTGVMLVNVTNGILENNEISRKYYGILLLNVTHCRFSINTVRACRFGIRLYYSGFMSSCELSGNMITDAAEGLGAGWSSNCTVANNIVSYGPYMGSHGITMWANEGCLLENNTIEAFTLGIMWYGNNSRLVKNIVDCGIIVRSSDNCQLEQNSISSTHGSYDGVLLSDSENCTLRSNTIHDSSFGIQLENSTDCLIVDNLVYENTEVGIFLDSSCIGNRVFGNEIGLNAQNAICNGSNNSWDDGVSRGNSWSDFYNTYQYVVPGEGQCIDHYPTPWFPHRTYEVSVLLLLGGVLYLLPVGIVVLGSRWKLVFPKVDQDDIAVPVRYLLVSRFRKRRVLKNEIVNEPFEPDQSDQ